MVPKDAADPEKMREVFSKMNGAKLCFVGHSHVPGVYPASEGYIHPDDVDGVYEVGDRPALINIGSVGQPRDKDPRACWVLYDSDKGEIEYRRLAYDFEGTKQRFDDAGLPEKLGRRIVIGA